MAADRLGRLPTILLALVVPLVALVTVVVTLNTTDDGGGGGAEGTAVSIENFQFAPTPIVVKAGAEIAVTNDDGTVHTLTADDKSFDTGHLDGGATGTISVAAPGHVRVPLRHPQLHDRHDRGEMSERRDDTELSTGTIVATVAGATALLVSGWVHFYLYFRGGYRGIAPDRVLGLTISRSFALNAIAALVIAEGLVLGLRHRVLLVPAATVGAGFAVATLVAYFLSRTRGLLGFEETATTTEAVIAMIAEAVALVALVPVAITERRARRHRAR